MAAPDPSSYSKTFRKLQTGSELAQRPPSTNVRELMPVCRRKSVLWGTCCACQCQWTPVVDFKNQIMSVS